ncbi:hypothetical protein [Desulfolutivibrio sulfoxidireducens]|uniref:hypothetical protein n=1 Tax=Desulfolutivibrio sulfoxidireducens TaxID=2773299 RepID=UPI00159E33E9|nr:hypothetical protein [Desulfolutivibrio sulfoxidireducens]QLA16339.1 hypothetical protein GD605_09515 [Desulfolutivibrio sulfoxidireducens]QLA19770.1 hypothetical protein GD604_08490 [Desulfolutivibrio sulfoxidireducens]
MKASRHVLAAIPLAAVVLAAGRPLSEACLAATASVLIDLDHLGDYLLCRGGWYGLKDFFSSCNEGRLNRLYLVLHAWEWIILGLCAALAWGFWPAGMVVLGMAWHLAFDQVGNRGIVTPGFYWITRRARVGFDAWKLYRDPAKIYA